MANKPHKLLTGTDLHEPKGIESVPAGQVYVSDGAGSGVWTTINTTVQFSTGDCKVTWKTVPDAGWIAPNNGETLGSPTSGATYAGTVYQSLYLLVWANFTNTWAPVTGGRGGSAAADYAANKPIRIPRFSQYTLGFTGGAGDLTVRTLGQLAGSETTTLTLAHLPAGIQSRNSVNPIGAGTTTPVLFGANQVSINYQGGGASAIFWTNGTMGNVGTSGTADIQVTSTNTSGQAHTIVQPTVFFNLHVKL